MYRTVLIFGISLALLLALLKWAEYSYFVKDMMLETYIGIVGMICTVLGGWIGWQLTRPKPGEVANKVEPPAEQLNGYNAENKFGLSPREYEVLVLIASGYSYQEIADKLFVSLSTVKTHASNIFSKMDVQRRTQAVMRAQSAGILPPAKA